MYCWIEITPGFRDRTSSTLLLARTPRHRVSWTVFSSWFTAARVRALRTLTAGKGIMKTLESRARGFWCFNFWTAGPLVMSTRPRPCRQLLRVHCLLRHGSRANSGGKLFNRVSRSFLGRFRFAWIYYRLENVFLNYVNCLVGSGGDGGGQWQSP